MTNLPSKFFFTRPFNNNQCPEIDRSTFPTPTSTTADATKYQTKTTTGVKLQEYLLPGTNSEDHTPTIDTLLYKDDLTLIHKAKDTIIIRSYLFSNIQQQPHLSSDPESQLSTEK